MAIKNVMKVELTAVNIEDSSKNYYADLILPASIYEIGDSIEKCRGHLEKTDMMPLSISECEQVPLLSELRFDSVTIYELNFLAKRISEFNNTQLAAYNAFLPLVVGENYERELISIKDLINLTYCVDDYSVAVNIFNDTDLGEMLIDNGMVEGIENLSDEMIEFLDAEKIGEAQRTAENGVYVNGCYITRQGFELKEIFDGETIPDTAIDKYLFRFSLTTGYEKVSWIEIPLNEDAKKFLENADTAEFNLWDFESAIPQISSYTKKMHAKITVDELNRINDIAKSYISANTVQRIIFKAALYYEDIVTFDDMDKIEWLLNNTDSFNLNSLNIFPADFAKDYLEQHLDDSFPKEYLKLINTQALGNKLMTEYKGAYTPYGVLLKNNHPQILINDSKHDFILADFLDKYVLFTEDRLKPQEVPKGLYKYEFRSGAEYRFAALEEKVGVDFSGTILSKVPFDLGEDEYIDLEEENGVDPDILSEEYTLNQYLSSDFENEETEEQTGGMSICQ